MFALMRDFGMKTRAVVAMDASAALGIVGRQGLGKIRHLDVNKLWLQQRRLREEFTFEKIKGQDNPADAFTKPLEWNNLERHMMKIGFQWSAGRAESAVQLNLLGAMLDESDDSEMPELERDDADDDDECCMVNRMQIEFDELIRRQRLLQPGM